MASLTKGSKVVLDETAGLQNATATPSVAGDSDDNDILVSSLPSAFSAFPGAVRAALSGYTGAVGNTGSDAFTVTAGSGAAITDVGFVGADGLALNGVDSGLLTLDGTKIFLYTGTNNNFVIGRVGAANGTADPGNDTANPSGAVAFVGYIDETTTNGAISGGKIWLTEYMPLKHPDPTATDEAIDLTNKVYVGVSQDQTFSLAGAPSGQQLFLMWTTAGATPDQDGRIPGVSIIATGRDPLNQSDSTAAITTGDTVNSSQGGGSTTLGTNNQAITEQEGLRFTFVSGAKADYVIPNLSPGEAGLESDIDFTAFFGARSATFQIVQETGGTTAMVKLTAINTAGAGGTAFIDSYANDLTTEKVGITQGSVSVKTFAGVPITAGVNITYNNDGTVLITGVPTDSQITYRTDSDHNRVLVENAGSLTAKNGDKTHADFDIGGFQVLQTSVDKLEVGSNMVWEDDAPGLTVGNVIGTGTVNPQYGYWTPSAGTDGLAAGVNGLDINATGFTIVRPDNTTATGTATLDPLSGSPDANGNFLFSGTLTADFDNNGTDDSPVHYYLTALANGTYKLDLVEGFVSTSSTVSTADGLTAGGPDAVQTLTPGAALHPPAPQTDKQIVFFNVLVTDSQSQVQSLIGGNPDLTEADIEGNSSLTPLLGTEAMNVSTSGIGVGNNNLNGNDTSSSGQDESFVANPEFDVTTLRVFIDNSVGGYTPATESLLYTLYYTDGTTSGAPKKVLASDIVAGAKANDPVHFDATAAAGKTIDAIQLTMDSGTIKIPYMEFITVTASPANDMQLSFQAVLTDGDGDTASSNFVANLYANELTGNFAYVQTGTSGADAFNIDLLDTTKTTYQVNSFTSGVDKLVLLGANNGYTINSSGGNTIVDITETASPNQHTIVTIVGATIVASDIATIT